MAHDLLSTLLRMIEVMAPAFTRPGFANAMVLFFGWVQTGGVHAVTEALVAAGVAGKRHHEAFHRFFSRGTWNPDTLGCLLLKQILKLLPEGAVVELVLDDTLAPKKGPKVFGIGNHLDPVHSTRRVRIFAFGHAWVVLSVVVRLPFSSRPWALPVMFRLYRTHRDCERRRTRHRKKTELAREMLDQVAGWLGTRRVRVATDSAYCNRTVLRGLAQHVHVVGAMLPKAVLTAMPTADELRRTGKRRVCGKRLPNPEQLAADRSVRWQSCTATLYGHVQKIYFKTLEAQWYSVAGTGLVRVVVVKVSRGSLRFRTFFSTDLSLSISELLETYAGRWSIEVCFRDLKQHLGFADPQSRKRAAVERTAPFIGYTYTTLVLWFAEEHVWRSPLAAPPQRPWYHHKVGLCFQDILRCAQRVMPQLDVLDPAGSLERILESPANHPPAMAFAAAHAA